jgi:hypothetical protein
MNGFNFTSSAIALLTPSNNNVNNKYLFSNNLFITFPFTVRLSTDINFSLLQNFQG